MHKIWLTIMCGMTVNTVLFWGGVIIVLTVPALTEHAKYLIAAVVVPGFALSPFIARVIAPCMHNWSKDEWQRGDVISG